MSDEVDGSEWLKKYYPEESARLVYYQTLSSEVVLNLNRSLIFLIAFWSIYSLKALKAFVDFVKSSRDSDLTFVVANADGVDELHEFSNLAQRGSGEVLWIRDGAIVGTLCGLYDQTSSILSEHTTRLFGAIE
jgi:hypothetical protein